MKIKEIWFDADYIYGRDDEGREYKQSLLWYQRLRQANDEERNNYTLGLDGIHWRNIDEDISFESFEYDNPEPTGVARLFLTYPELNASAIGRRLGISQSLMAQYINGIKKPSLERERLILDEVLKIAQELVKACA